jgi:hypothetical protein
VIAIDCSLDLNIILLLSPQSMVSKKTMKTTKQARKCMKTTKAPTTKGKAKGGKGEVQRHAQRKRTTMTGHFANCRLHGKGVSVEDEEEREKKKTKKEKEQKKKKTKQEKNDAMAALLRSQCIIGGKAGQYIIEATQNMMQRAIREIMRKMEVGFFDPEAVIRALVEQPEKFLQEQALEFRRRQDACVEQEEMQAFLNKMNMKMENACVGVETMTWSSLDHYLEYRRLQLKELEEKHAGDEEGGSTLDSACSTDSEGHRIEDFMPDEPGYKKFMERRAAKRNICN